MTGHAMPWNHDPSGQQKEDAANARALQAKQKTLADQQERLMAQQRRKLNAQQIAMLRSRYGVASGGSSLAGGAPGSGMMQGMSDTAGSLFTRITGS